jgi:LPXTG-motif cell wall-anchored protein
MSFTIVIKKDSTSQAFIIENEPGAALPNTGGPGNTPFTFLGVLATATSGTLLVVRKKRRRRRKA